LFRQGNQEDYNRLDRTRNTRRLLVCKHGEISRKSWKDNTETDFSVMGWVESTQVSFDIGAFEPSHSMISNEMVKS
jgi:hypothetical protein